MKTTLQSKTSYLQHIEYLRQLFVTKKKYSVEVKEYRKKRTTSQNALMWMWLDGIAKEVGREIGYDKDDMHEVFMEMFLVPKIITIKGVDYKKYSTKDLNTKEMSEYMDAISRFAVSEWNIFVPLPEELQNGEQKND